MESEYTYHAYFEAVRTYAQEVIDLAGTNVSAQATCIDNIITYSNWVTMYFQATRVIEYSQNDAMYENLGIELKGTYDQIVYTVAREALRQDIIEEVGSLQKNID